MAHSSLSMVRRPTLFALALCVIVPHVGAAAPVTVAVAPLDASPGSARAQAQLDALEAPDLRLLVSPDVGAQMQALNVNLGRRADRLKLMRGLGAQGLLRTRLGRVRGRHTAEISLVTGITGRTVDRLVLRAKRRSRLNYLITKRVAPWVMKNAERLGSPLPDVRLGMLELAASKAEAAVLGALERQDGLTVLRPTALQKAAESVTGGLFEAPGRAEVARQLNLQLFLRLRITRIQRRYTANAEIIDARTGQRTAAVKARAKTTRTLSARLLRALAPHLKRAADARLKPAPSPAPVALIPTTPAPPQPPAPAPAPPAPAPPAHEPEPAVPADGPPPTTTAQSASAPPREQPLGLTRSNPQAHQRGPSALRVGAGFGFMSRRLSYTDDLFETLRPYELQAAPVVQVFARAYPAAFALKGWAAACGLEANLSYGLGLSSKDAADRTYDTQALAFDAALRARWAFSRHELGLAVGGGLQRFSVKGLQSQLEPGLPGVGYAFVRVGADARFTLIEDLSLRPRFGWRNVLSGGEMTSDSWFPRASVLAFDAELCVAYRVWSGLEVQAGAQWQRYAYDLGVQPEDPHIAGGAVDQYWSGNVAVSWSFLGR